MYTRTQLSETTHPHLHRVSPKTIFTWDASVCATASPSLWTLGHSGAFSAHQTHRKKKSLRHKNSFVFRRFTAVSKQRKAISASSQMKQTFTDRGQQDRNTITINPALYIKTKLLFIQTARETMCNDSDGQWIQSFYDFNPVLCENISSLAESLHNVYSKHTAY